VIGAPGTVPTAGHDGVKELVLFSSTQNAPGNFGSLDLGSASNGTPELARQLRYGPNQSDFTIMDNNGKLGPKLTAGAGQPGRGPGISNGTRTTGPRSSGRTRSFRCTTRSAATGTTPSTTSLLRGVRIVAADLQGNPKRVWVQRRAFIRPRSRSLHPGRAA